MHVWYIKRQGKIKGPFPAGQISQSLLLGRLVLQDEVSHDKQTWQTIAEVPELVPEVLKVEQLDPTQQERLRAARRWADERREDRRGESRSEVKDRRESASPLRDTSPSTHEMDSPWRVGNLIIPGLASLLLVGLIYAVWIYSPKPVTSGSHCDERPTKGVNWSHCRLAGLQAIRSELQGAVLDSAQMNGANLLGSNLANASMAYVDLSMSYLSYANLSDANLKGANLQGADLTHAKINNADLSYADLQNAQIDNAEIKGVRLGNAIWVDGRTCKAESLGACL